MRKTRFLVSISAFALLSSLALDRASGDILSATYLGADPNCAISVEVGAMDEDVPLYCDRTHEWNAVPAPLVGTTFVKTSNSDKQDADLAYDVEVEGPGFLLLYIDNRAGNDDGGQDQYSPLLATTDPGNPNTMEWVQDGVAPDFADTGADVGIDEGGNGDINQWFSIFAMEIGAGTEVVTLLTHDTKSGGRNQYLIGFVGSIDDLRPSVVLGGNRGGWIPTAQWNILGPLTQPGDCGPGISNMNRNQVGPHDIDTEDPSGADFDEWPDIDFLGSAFATGWGGSGITPTPTWFTTTELANAFALPPGLYPNNTLVNYQSHIADFINTNVNPTPNLPGDDVMYVATTYVENTGAPLDVDVCTASDDSIQVRINGVIVTNVNACRGSSGGCQETRPAVIPTGLSKIVTQVWEGGGGHNFRLRLMKDGAAIDDRNDLGIVFHGHTPPSLPGSQSQYATTRTISQDPEDPSQAQVVITGAGPGADGDMLTVVEDVRFSNPDFTIGDLDPAGTFGDIIATQGQVNGNGFVEALLFAGPFINSGGAGPGDARLMDPQLYTEETDPGYNPVPGDALSNIPGTRGNPAGKTADHWEAWFGGANFNFNNWYAGDVNNNTVVTATYAHVAADTDVFFGVGSDDSWDLRIDGAYVAHRNIPRGCGGANSVQDYFGPFTLTAGVHFVAVGIWEGGGGHCGRWGFFSDQNRTPAGGITYSLSPDNTDPYQEVQGQRITFENVPRSMLNGDGVSYTTTANSGLVNLSFSGRVPGDVGATGGDSSVVLNICPDPGLGPIGIFDNFRDVGSPNVPGDIAFDAGSGEYTQLGQGGDIWNGGDQMSFAYQMVTGDFIATARVTERIDPVGGSRWGKHGLMARDSCVRGSRYTMIQTNLATDQGEGGQREPIDLPRVAFRRNHNTDGSNDDSFQVDDGMLPGTPEGGFGIPNDRLSRRPEWHRLIRTGNLITGYLSFADENGDPAGWCLVGSHSHPGRAETLMVGMALTSHSGEPGTIVYDNVTIEPYAPVALVGVPEGKPVLEANYDSEGDGNPPDGAFIAQRSGAFTPQVQGGRLRMTQDGENSSATAAWYRVNEADGPALVNGGFEIEADVRFEKNGIPGDTNPADGASIAVVVNGADYLIDPVCGTSGTLVDEFDTSAFIGTDVGGGSSSSQAGDVYTNISSSGGDLWDGCDDFQFDYTDVAADTDFDVSIEFVSRTHSATGRWGKFGIMARQSLDRDSRFSMIQDHLPDLQDPSRAAGRRQHLGNCATMYEVTTSIAHPTYIRLTRRGTVVQAWVSDDAGLGDGTLDPHNDCNWIAGHAEDWGEAPAVHLGFANSEHNSDGAGTQTIEYRILQPNPGGVVRPPPLLTDLGGDGGGSMGWQAGTLRSRTECHPSFNIEFDNWVGGGNNETNGSTGNDPRVHVGLNVNAWADSPQTSDDFGASDIVPYMYGNDTHVRIRYLPNGQVDAWMNDAHVISYAIPPLHMGTNEVRSVAIGYTGGTGGANFTSEFDNLLVSPLCSEQEDSVSIAGADGGGADHVDTTGAVTLTAEFSGADGAVNYSWEITDDGGTGATITDNMDGTATVESGASGNVTVKVTANDDNGCSDEDSTDEHTITFDVGIVFNRGDDNQDGSINIADAQYSLNRQFLGGPPFKCLAAADVNADGSINIADAQYNLNFQFLGGPPPPAPFFRQIPAAGCDSSNDPDDLELGCEDAAGCPNG